MDVELLVFLLLQLLGREGVHICLLWGPQNVWAGRGPRRLSGCELQSLGERSGHAHSYVKRVEKGFLSGSVSFGGHVRKEFTAQFALIGGQLLCTEAGRHDNCPLDYA